MAAIAESIAAYEDERAGVFRVSENLPQMLSCTGEYRGYNPAQLGRTGTNPTCWSRES
jgi:hypothetical protein